jgi:pseudouridine synthase
MSENVFKRLQKFLSEQGVCSRREAENLIFAGDVMVNGEIAKIGAKVDGSEKIKIHGKHMSVINDIKPVLFAWNKPVGVEVTFQESRENLTMNDFDFGIIKPITVGRLDKDSHGLLLVTNDGNLANYLTHPKYNHDKEYLVKVNKEITKEISEKLSNGSILLGDKKALPCNVEKIGSHGLKIILKEGRNRQIRKMCKACGLRVEDLLRVKYKDIKLGDLESGKFREVDIPEIPRFL